MSLNDRTILITGAAGGLGSSLAYACAKLGAELILLDKNRRGLVQLSDQITEAGLNAPGLYPMDLAGVGPDELTGLLEVVEAEYGGLDGLVHCAVDFDGLQPLEQIQPQHWLRAMQVNVNTPWLLTTMLLPFLRKSKEAYLVFMLDELDEVTGAYWGAYGAGKSALAGLVNQFGDALSNSTVRVRGIKPGPMRTAFRAKVYHAESPAEQPDPAIVAAKIAALLGGNEPSSERILDYA
jgi:NAD(P)-dependent dehydrogenase (short-subunit alcohol dehydrogenase family)